MEDLDKTIEVIKAAMEKEKADKSDNSMDKKIDKAEAPAACRKDDEDNEMMKKQEDEAMETDTPDKEKPSKDEKSSKSFLKGSKNKELAAKETQIQELTDRLMRTMAEFDNFRKRTEKEKSQMYDLGVKSIVEKLLPVIDNFERGLDSVSDADKDNPLVQGFNMIYKQLITTMDEIGVKPIEAVGNEFNPNLHNAVMHGEDENMGENIVAEEYQKGYMYRDTVVRHSMVKVVN